MKDPEFARECLLASKHYQAERRRIKKRIKARENITKGRREKSRIILSLGDGYNVLKPIRIRLKRYADNDFVADWIAVRAYGYGESPEEAIENLMKDRTSLVIAHRLSTIQHATVIHVLREG